MSSILFYTAENRNFFEKKTFRKNYILKKMDRVARRGPLARAPGALKSHNAEKLKEGTLWGFSTSILSQNIKKSKGGNFFRKKISVPKKTVRGTLWDFPTSILTQNSKKIEGGLFGGIFFEKKSRCAEKKGDPLVSPGMVCYAEKQEKPFWFSSLGQIVQFVAIIFCRTFKN